jgi:ATP-dependent HslUV protease ATP-binding subunit HslU
MADKIPQMMSPREIFDTLSKNVVGQDAAKKAVANALRTRWRRMQVAPDLRSEICPKNILMIGSTGIGKTEIARRLAALAGAPFIKVEATKFTEVGYVGRDVDSIIRDLVEAAVRICRERAQQAVMAQAEEVAEDLLVEAMYKLKKKRTRKKDDAPEAAKDDGEGKKRLKKEAKLELLRALRQGKLDHDWVEIDVSLQGSIGVEIMAPPGMEEMTDQLQSLFQHLGSEKKRKRKMKVKEALRTLKEEESARMINEDEVRLQALEETENNGIVFLDEIDKVVRPLHRLGGADVSREGVQRDLLPLLEGTTVATKYGLVKTDHVLFIASGAFLASKPTDMISELQGRLPIRVTLKDLTEKDFCRILVEPAYSLVKQYEALLATEGVKIRFVQSGIKCLAHIAFTQNERFENIGARRLYTVIERCLEDLSFSAPDHEGQSIKIDEAFVKKSLKAVIREEDIAQFIL